MKLHHFSILGLALVLSACSSSETSPVASGPDVPPAADAATDAIPQAAAENNAAPPTLEMASKDSVPPPPEPAPDQNAPQPVPSGEPQSQPQAINSPSTSASPDQAVVPAPPDVAQAPAPEHSSAPEALAPVASNDSSAGEGTGYTVQEGDTLMKIAYETYGDIYKWKEIYEDNKDKLSDPNSVPKGMQLKLRKEESKDVATHQGDAYTIKSGDTLGTIAADVYGTQSKWKKIWKNNKGLIKNPNRIFAGFTLYYTMTPAEREEAEKLKNSATPDSSKQAMADSVPPPPTNDTRAPASVAPAPVSAHPAAVPGGATQPPAPAAVSPPVGAPHS